MLDFIFYIFDRLPGNESLVARHDVASCHDSFKIHSYYRHHHVHRCTHPLTQRVFAQVLKDTLNMD